MKLWLKCKKSIFENEGTSTWINAQKMLLLVYLNKQEYAKANVTINDLSNNPSYYRTVSAFKRQIALIGVYCIFSD